MQYHMINESPEVFLIKFELEVLKLMFTHLETEQRITFGFWTETCFETAVWFSFSVLILSDILVL